MQILFLAVQSRMPEPLFEFWLAILHFTLWLLHFAGDRVQVHYIPCRQRWYTKAHFTRGVTVKTKDLLSAAELSGAEMEGIQSLPVA